MENRDNGSPHPDVASWLLVFTAIVVAVLFIRLTVISEAQRQTLPAPTEFTPETEGVGTGPTTGTIVGKRKVGIVCPAGHGRASVIFRRTIFVELDESGETISVVLATEEAYKKATIGRRVTIHLPRDPATRSTPIKETVI